jgi:hypothetical protein
MIRLPRPHLPRLGRSAREDASSMERDEAVLNRGQIIVLFAGALLFFIGIMGLAIDMSYLWVNEMRMQKAADGAALAGAVYLPDDPAQARTAALAMATRNGYSGGTGVTIDAHQDSKIIYQMDVTVTARVPTFFMRAFGVNSLTPARTAHAQYNLPLPMGSPLNVFGDPNATDLSGNKLNFWAAIQGPCTTKVQGDPFATKSTTAAPANCSTAGVSNGEYRAPSAGDPGAYNYAIKVLSGGTTIQLYDPQYCMRSDMSVNTGDTGFTTTSKFNTTFTLYAPSDTPYDLADDVVLTSVTYPGNNGTATTDGQGGKTNSCSSYYVTGTSAANYTGKWLTFASVGGSGTYRLNIQTTPSGTSPADAFNSFAVKAVGGSAQVFAGGAVGESAMSIWNNFTNADARIYLAQINSSCAGKTLQVELFDPGETTGNGTLRFEMPSGSTYSTVSFNWRDAGTSMSTGGTLHTNVTSLTTASGGSSLFNGHWVVVTIKIPVTYEATSPLNGWWKIRYTITGTAHERTTWRVEIKDAPVHLVP